MSNKYEILTRLREGDEPTAIAEELDVSIASIVRHRAELNNAIRDDKLNTLMASCTPSASELVDTTFQNSPPEVKAAANELSKGLKALERLQPELIRTASALNSRIAVMCSTAENVGELEALTQALCKLQTAFFPSAGTNTQVNIQNNSGGTMYGQWLSDKPGTV